MKNTLGKLLTIGVLASLVSCSKYETLTLDCKTTHYMENGETAYTVKSDAVVKFNPRYVLDRANKTITLMGEEELELKIFEEDDNHYSAWMLHDDGWRYTIRLNRESLHFFWIGDKNSSEEYVMNQGPCIKIEQQI